MTTQETITIIGSLGFPIFLIISVMLFIDKRVFPAITKYLQDRAIEEKKQFEDRAVEENRRHDQYLGQQREHLEQERQHNALIAKLIDTDNALNITSHGIAQLIAALIDKEDDHHAEIMRELRGKQ